MDDSHGSTQEAAVAPVLSVLEFAYLLIRPAPVVSNEPNTPGSRWPREIRSTKLEMRNRPERQMIRTRKTNPIRICGTSDRDRWTGARQTNPISPVLGREQGSRRKTKPIGVCGRPAIGNLGLRIGDSSRRGRRMSNKPNWAGRGVGGHGPPYGMVGEKPGARNVEQSQFGAGEKAPRSSGGRGDECKYNWNRDLGFMLCALCGSVVKNPAGVSEAMDFTASPSSGLRKLLPQKLLGRDRRGACSPGPAFCGGKRRPATRDRPARRGASRPPSRCSGRL